MSETLEKDKKLGQEEEEEYVLLELDDCLYSDISPGAPFVLSVSWFFSGSTSLRLTCYVLCHSIIEYQDLQLSLDFLFTPFAGGRFCLGFSLPHTSLMWEPPALGLPLC